MATSTSAEYARLALEPDEALRNIFLAICSKTGIVSKSDFMKFIYDSGACDDQIAEEMKTNILIEYENLDFPKFKNAMV
jgi:hypothetical protein